MKLTIANLLFLFKKTIIFVFCFLFCFTTFSSNLPTYNRSPLDETAKHSDYPGSNSSNKVEQAPYSNYYSDYGEYRSDSSVPTNPTYIGLAAPLEKYYESQVNIFGNLNGKHEENYVYSDGRKEINYYSGVLSHIIKDFDNDTIPEMALFKIRTTSMGELATKEIVMEMVRLLNGVAAVSDTMVVCAQIFDGEDIECNVGVKKIDETWRIYLNYFEHKVLAKEYITKFIAIDYPNVINVLCDINYSGVEDEVDVEGSYDYQNQILDTGIVLRDDSNIFKRNYLYDDVNISPVFVIIRVNESMEDGFIEHYTETHFDELTKNGFVKVRYGYTNFIDRTSGKIYY